MAEQTNWRIESEAEVKAYLQNMKIIRTEKKAVYLLHERTRCKRGDGKREVFVQRNGSQIRCPVLLLQYCGRTIRG